MRKVKKLKMVTAALLAIVMMLPVAIAAQPDPAVTRESVTEALTAAIEHHYDEYGLDFAEMLASVNVDVEGFADLLYINISASVEFRATFSSAFRDEMLPLHVDIYVTAFVTQYEAGTPETVIQNLVISARAIEILGFEAGINLFSLPIFWELNDLFGHGWFVGAFYHSPNFTAALTEYGADILYALDFNLSDAITTYLAYGLATDGLQLLNRMLDTDIVIHMFEISGMDVEFMQLLIEINRLFATVTWDNIDEINLDESNLEERMTFDTADIQGLDILISPAASTGTNGYDLHSVQLNVFFRNASDAYAIFYIVGSGGVYAFTVPAGGERTVQLPAEVIYGSSLAVVAMSHDGERIEGELAIRLTEHPLPN